MLVCTPGHRNMFSLDLITAKGDLANSYIYQTDMSNFCPHLVQLALESLSTVRSSSRAMGWKGAKTESRTQERRPGPTQAI
jgi:hypothetical protein